MYIYIFTEQSKRRRKTRRNKKWNLHFKLLKSDKLVFPPLLSNLSQFPFILAVYPFYFSNMSDHAFYHSTALVTCLLLLPKLSANTKLLIRLPPSLSCRHGWQRWRGNRVPVANDGPVQMWTITRLTAERGMTWWSSVHTGHLTCLAFCCMI